MMKRISTIAPVGLLLLFTANAFAQRPATLPAASIASGKTEIAEPRLTELKFPGERLQNANSRLESSNATVVTTDRLAGSPAANSKLYRIGPGDVLDVRLVGHETKESTLFTVLQDGKLDYPLLNQPVFVSGLTPEEVSVRLAREIRILNRAAVAVSVRDYSSHKVLVTGLVSIPGEKALRREAVPLYVLLAEAQVNPEAQFARLIRKGQGEVQIALKDEKGMAAAVVAGDTVVVSAPRVSSNRFYFIIGEISLPGQKDFYDGMTLTQAVMACGGVKTESAKIARIMRRGNDGKLSSKQYDIAAILGGQVADPELSAGDRIEIAK